MLYHTSDNQTSYSLDTSEYHTYRLTVGGRRSRLHVDGILRCDLTGNTNASGLERITWQSQWVKDNESWWDHIYYSIGKRTDWDKYNPSTTSWT